MTLKTKLFLGTMSLTFISIVVVGFLSVSNARRSLRDAAVDKLKTISFERKDRIEELITQIHHQVATFSEDRMIVDAAKQFKAAFHGWEAEAGLSEGERQRMDEKVKDYYRREFLPRLTENVNQTPNLETYYPTDPQTRLAQYHYLAANPAPTGSKDEMNQAPNGGSYSRIHALYHPIIRDYLKNFAYYDIFIVDPDTGHIVYSVFKEVDYGTSLLTGPYAQTNFGKLFQKIRRASDPNTVEFADFDHYDPSYAAPAAFIGSPIFDAGQLIGVLIFQMPVDRINDVMTSGGQWREIGQGDTWQSYLLGADEHLRSNSRELIEHKSDLLNTMRAAGMDAEMIEKMDDLNTSILVQHAQNEAARNALAGQTGTTIFTDFRGHTILSAYAPLVIEGAQWAVIAEVAENEALQPAKELTKKMIWGAVVILLFGLLGSYVLARSITRPLSQVVAILKDISEGEGDLTRRLDLRGEDEIGELSRYFNQFVESIHHTVSEIIRDVEILKQSVTSVEQMSGGLSTLSNDLLERARETSLATDQMSTDISNVSQQAQEVSESTQSIAGATEQMTSTIAEISANVHRTTEFTGAAVAGSNQAVEVMTQLELAAREADEVVTFIETISEQTKLLALNATIESARAGDAGKGFAVVAGEVKGLAREASEAAERIRARIQAMTTHATQSVESMNKVAELIQDINDVVTGTAGAVEEQSVTTGDIAAGAGRAADSVRGTKDMIRGAVTSAGKISENMGRVHHAGEDLARRAGDLTQAAAQLAHVERQLGDLVNHFKV